LGFAIVCADRTAGAKHLLAPDLSDAVASRQCAISTGDPKREIARALTQVSVFM
jgi:hypothetical protein